MSQKGLSTIFRQLAPDQGDLFLNPLPSSLPRVLKNLILSGLTHRQKCSCILGILRYCRNALQHWGVAMDASSGINKDTGKVNRFLSPQRVTITVPSMTLKKLLKRSLVEGRSVSNLAAFLLEQALEWGSQD